MEEKRYPIIEEEDGMLDKACEPVAVVETSVAKDANGVTTVHDWIDDLDWDRFPILGPKTEEEAIARIDKFEERLAKGEVKWTPSEEAWQQLYEKFPWLR